MAPIQAAPLSNARPVNVPQTLAQALDLHKAGRLAEAEKLYAAILAARPDHFDALQMLGLVKLARGRPAEALQLVATAMRVRKPSPQVLLNHGLVLNALHRHEEALASFDLAIRQKSKFADAHNNRAAVLAALGRDNEAIEAYGKALAISPAYPEAHYNLGNLYRSHGRNDEALQCYDRALASRPKYADAHNNRGTVLMLLKREQEALAAFEAALDVNAAHPDALKNRIAALNALGRYDEALRPRAGGAESAETLYGRGKLLSDQNRYAEAVECYRQALVLRPGYADAAFASCIAELPILYADEAERTRQRQAYAERLARLCKDHEAGRLNGDLARAMATNQPFLLAYQGENDRDLRGQLGELSCRVAGGVAAALPPPPLPGERVRIGVVSSGFYLHSNWKIPIKGWIGQLDRSRFEVFGYHLGPIRDAETEAAAAMCSRFVHRTLEADGWRREILSDAPHVLIYPGLCMDNISGHLAAQRLAPVQMTSWGHPETSGLPTMDYFLSSDLMEPPDADSHYTERLVRLPNLSIFYEADRFPPVFVTRPELGLRDGTTAFWCGQSLFKYLPQYDEVFPRIAKAAGDCQFAFIRHQGGEGINELFRWRLDRAFAAHGLNMADHCVFLPRLGADRFVAAIGQCDIFLDSIGWSGCNSTLESLPHNLPIVTLPGPLMRGRHSAAILQMMGVTETIAETLDGYVDLAASLARDPDRRAAIGRTIAERKHLLYGDRTCITALENLIDSAARQPQ